ncbi:MAG: DNA-binding protein [Candidatus Bilamarchaeaceae archaeon]
MSYEGDIKEEEEIKKKKMAEYKKKLEAQQKANEELKKMLRQVLDDKGYERLNNVSFSNQQLYMMAAQQVLLFAKRAGRKITEEEVLYILNAIKKQTEKESKITFIKK